MSGEGLEGVLCEFRGFRETFMSVSAGLYKLERKYKVTYEGSIDTQV